jgi:hypothetical protein
MQLEKRFLHLVAAASLICGLSATAHAQIGSGWTAYSPSMRTQLAGSGTYSISGGVETFRLTSSSSTDVHRAERRVENEWSSGTNQFEGQVRVVSLGGTGISLKQTFQPESGAFLMIAVQNDGRLYEVGGGVTLASGVIGSTLRVNTVTDVSASKTYVYINGELKQTRNGGNPPFHDKYGTYRLGSGRGPVTAEWSGIKFWRNGSISGGGGGGGGGSTATFEAENVARTHSGTGTSVQTDASTSNGQWISLDAENTGSWMEFTTPTIAAGTYSVTMKWKGHPSRGQLSLKIDGTQIGSTLDQYSASPSYPTTTFGNVTFSSSGTHKIRLTVTGKNSASSNYILSADQFSLVAP